MELINADVSASVPTTILAAATHAFLPRDTSSTYSSSYRLNRAPIAKPSTRLEQLAVSTTRAPAYTGDFGPQDGLDKSQDNKDLAMIDRSKGDERLDPDIHTPKKDFQIPTLSSLVSTQTLSGKRKRSITHIEGIPISILSQSTSPPSPSITSRKIISSRKIKQLDKCFSVLSLKNNLPLPAARKTVGSRSESDSDYEEEDEEEVVSSISTTHSNSARSSGSFVSTSTSSAGKDGRSDYEFGYAVGYDRIEQKEESSNISIKAKRVNSPSDSVSDHGFDPDSDSSSDDEDDVVFLLSP
ncbi:uncharacterized protein L199_008053 [Kwoniella botswanensis]|uniref:uncharacterized protein n=1 Tax=Kwoniella botswanensis TaxID=1268659 RepID=UPI00315DC54E